MSRKSGHYAAKFKQQFYVEVIYVSSNGKMFRPGFETAYNESDFAWISDEPVTLPKPPVELKNDHYYAVSFVNWDGRTKQTIGRYAQNSMYIYGTARTDYTVLSEGITVEELIQLPL